MLVTVSTVKDVLPNVERFVRRNLAGGADHMIVFLDVAPDDDGEHEEVEAWLHQQPHVTCVRADETWWAGDRPVRLSRRQSSNANVARALMTVLDPGGWIFHVDADEVVQVDRVRLDELPHDVAVLSLAPLEAVSRPRWEGEVTHFKRLLDADDLTLLTTLGVLPTADNAAYFRGHVDGKSGMRHALDRWHTLHRVVDAENAKVASRRTSWARLLHYESFSGEEFVRKWTAMLTAGPTPQFRPGRRPTAIALRRLLAKGLDAATTTRYLERIYAETTEDDFATLLDLGLLEEIDPDAGTHVPAPLGDDRAAALDAMLAAVPSEPRETFLPGAPPAEVEALVDRLADAAGVPAPSRRG